VKTNDKIAQFAAKREAGRLREERRESGLVARLTHGRELRRRIKWPGTAVEVDIAVLTQRARSEAVAAAMTQLRAQGIDDGKPAPQHFEHATTEHMVQILARALRDPDTGELVFSGGLELADAATEDEIAILFGEYSAFREEVDPSASSMPQAEWDAFLGAVKKKEPASWSSIASTWPRSWLLTSVDRLATSLTSNSPSTPSDGAPLEAEIPGASEREETAPTSSDGRS
jgi:hypothetical protein